MIFQQEPSTGEQVSFKKSCNDPWCRDGTCKKSTNFFGIYAADLIGSDDDTSCFSLGESSSQQEVEGGEPASLSSTEEFGNSETPQQQQDYGSQEPSYFRRRREQVESKAESIDHGFCGELFRRVTFGGCETCSYGDRSSWGYDSDCDDERRNMLPKLEATISGKISYPPFRNELQKHLSAVFDWKETMRDLTGFDDNPEDLATLKDLYYKCDRTTDRIERLLSDCQSKEEQATAELGLLSCSIYKCHLQEWSSTTINSSLEEHKLSTPSKYVSSIAVIVNNVVPFLLGDESFWEERG